jgi:hypothetical protein
VTLGAPVALHCADGIQIRFKRGDDIRGKYNAAKERVFTCCAQQTISL